jgi:two-component system, OmpR family, KDP operon response regulator KdpE
MGDRVLVVDDDLSILRVVAANLRARGYEALTAASGTVALRVIETQQPDCIVLDLGLPDLGGLEVLRRLRAWTATPVVILTAVGDERDKTTALDLGADDYVTKPFAMTELLARVHGALRHGRSQSLDRPRTIEVGPVCIDLDAGLVTRWGQPVQLTRIEYRLLEILATSEGRL